MSDNAESRQKWTLRRETEGNRRLRRGSDTNRPPTRKAETGEIRGNQRSTPRRTAENAENTGNCSKSHTCARGDDGINRRFTRERTPTRKTAATHWWTRTPRANPRFKSASAVCVRAGHGLRRDSCPKCFADDTRSTCQQRRGGMRHSPVAFARQPYRSTYPTGSQKPGCGIDSRFGGGFQKLGLVPIRRTTGRSN